MKFLVRSFLVTLVGLGLLLLNGPGSWAVETVIDQVGRPVRVPADPQRVVALAPSIVEIVFELGAGQRLVGATEFSDYPEAAKALPRVGSYASLDVERIVALKPDLCLAIKDGNPEFAVKRLESFGIPVYVIDPRNLAEIIEVVERFGGLLGATAKGQELTRSMRARIAAVRERLAGVSYRPLVFFQIDAAPMISAGTGTFIDELITLAGGRNAAAGPLPYPRFNWEQILRVGPEVVMVASMAGGHRVEELVDNWQQWPQLPAVRNHRVHVVDANLIDRPSPRLIDGLVVFARIIQPELYKDGQ